VSGTKIPRNRISFAKTNSPQAQIADSSSTNAVSFSLTCHNETLSVAMRIYNPDRSPAKPPAETQPKLQPVLLRLSAMIFHMNLKESVFAVTKATSVSIEKR